MRPKCYIMNIKRVGLKLLKRNPMFPIFLLIKHFTNNIIFSALFIYF